MRRCNKCHKKENSVDPCTICYTFYCYSCFPGHLCRGSVTPDKFKTRDIDQEDLFNKNEKEDTFKVRNSNGMNKGEESAEKYFKRFNGLSYFKYGFDHLYSNIPVENFVVIPQFVRCTPDYVTIFNGEFTFIEVKCCVGSLKIKLTDFVEYGKWSNIASFKLLVVNKENIYVLKYEELLNYLSVEGNKFGRYKDNGKLYFEIPLENIQKFKK